MRKTRKFPNMFGSIRKRKKHLNFARQLGNWQRQVFGDGCKVCVSEPICMNRLNWN